MLMNVNTCLYIYINIYLCIYTLPDYLYFNIYTLELITKFEAISVFS